MLFEAQDFSSESMCFGDSAALGKSAHNSESQHILVWGQEAVIEPSWQDSQLQDVNRQVKYNT